MLKSTSAGCQKSEYRVGIDKRQFSISKSPKRCLYIET